MKDEFRGVFEIIQDGHVKFRSHNIAGAYEHNTLKSMQRAGCTFRWNGKNISLSKLENMKAERPL